MGFDTIGSLNKEKEVSDVGTTQIWFDKIDKLCHEDAMYNSILSSDTQKITDLLKELIDDRPTPRDYLIDLLQEANPTLEARKLVRTVQEAFDEHHLADYEKARSAFYGTDCTVPSERQVSDFLSRKKTVKELQGAAVRTRAESRARVLDYCVGLKLTLEQTERMLEKVLLVNGLNPKDPLEAIIFYVLRAPKSNMVGTEILNWWEEYSAMETSPSSASKDTVILGRELSNCKNDADFSAYLGQLKSFSDMHRGSARRLYTQLFTEICLESRDYDEMENQIRKEREKKKKGGSSEIKDDIIPQYFHSVSSNRMMDFFRVVRDDIPNSSNIETDELLDQKYLAEIFRHVPFGRDSIKAKLEGRSEVLREDLLLLIFYKHCMRPPKKTAYSMYKDVILPFRNEVRAVLQQTGMFDGLYVRNPFELFLCLCLILNGGCDVDYFFTSWYYSKS